MQGQSSAGNSFAETIDLNQGSVSSNNGVSQPTPWNSMLYPMDNPSVQNFGGWHVGESSSSSNLQSQGLGSNLKIENGTASHFDAPPESDASMEDGQFGPSNILREGVSRPISLQSSGSSRMLLNINLNAEHMASGSEGGNGFGQEPERYLTANVSPNDARTTGNSSNLANYDRGSSSPMGNWGSSCKRKALEGGSSNCFQQAERFDQHDSHACHSASSSLSILSPPVNSPIVSPSEQLSLRIGIGRGVASDAFSPLSVTETGESSSRNYGFRVNEGTHDFNRFNIPSTRNSIRHSDIYSCRQPSRPLSPPDFLEFRPAASVTPGSSNFRNQPQLSHTSDLSRNMPSFPWAPNSRGGGSSNSGMFSAERGMSSRDEANFESLLRNSMEHSPFVPPTERRSNWNLSPENTRTSTGHFPIAWTSQHHGSARNHHRSSHFSPWALFPSMDSEPGDQRGHFPPLPSGPSSSDERIMSSGANQGHHPFHPRSSMLELPGDDASGWHALVADIEGRQRLVSEIRQVLDAMRRGENLRDEDYMIFDPFINGIAEFHDRHRDMRLDVDSMSYEELLALEDRIGNVNTGLSEEAILKSMQQRKHLSVMERSLSNLEPCSICREEYATGDDIGTLDCGHDFHTNCIKQWLTQKNLCPICKMTALGP